jgi:cytochrome P450
MLCILFDMPWEQRHDIKRWSDWASNIGPETQNEGYRAAFMQQMMEMLQRFDGFMDARRNLPPSDDLLSRMVHSDAMGNMSPIERLSNIALLIVGGNDTTRNSMSALVEAFQKFPGEVDKLRTDPSLAANAAQEIIRWQSPVTHMRRTAVKDTDLGGQKIAKGEKVVMWYISANRDERVFPDANRFDVTRANARRHIAFGHGIHRCVGARLAEIQVGTLIEDIAQRRLQIVPQAAPTRLASPFLHGFTAMPVQLRQD